MKSLLFAVVLCLPVALAIQIIGCSGGHQNQTVVAISPRIASVCAGQQQNFSVSIQHDHHSGLGVNWTLSPASGSGTLSTTPMAATYTAPATVPANSSVTITAAAQVDSSVTDSVTFNITSSGCVSGNDYVGAQSPGDIWLFTLDDTGHQFSATNQTANLTYTGTTQLLPNGFLKTTIVNSNDPNLPVGSSGYAVEVPQVAAMLALGGGTDKPVALVAQSPCPTLAAPTTVQLINLGKSTYDSTQSESYASVNATQSSSTFNFSINSYLLDGTVRTAQSGQLPSGTCSGGVITISNVPTGSGSTTVTIAAATNGLYIVDLGPGRGAAVGSQNFVVDATTRNTAMSETYIGAIFRRNSTPITTLAGFGPGSGTSISGGAFTNQDTDLLSAHATNVTINLTTENAEGFLQGDVNDTASGIDHSPFVAMVTQNNGKFFIFGITTDTSTTTPYVILLAQQ